VGGSDPSGDRLDAQLVGEAHQVLSQVQGHPSMLALGGRSVNRICLSAG